MSTLLTPNVPTVTVSTRDLALRPTKEGRKGLSDTDTRRMTPLLSCDPENLRSCNSTLHSTLRPTVPHIQTFTIVCVSFLPTSVILHMESDCDECTGLP